MFYASVIVLLFIPNLKVLVRLIIVVLLTLNYFTFSQLIDSNDKLKFTYLDAGNSSACLISTPGNKNILIGCGNSTVKYNSAERNIIPYLKRQGIDKIDILIMPSLNKDEYRNLREFAKSFNIGKLYIPSYYKNIFESDGVGFSLKNNKIVFIDNSIVIKNDVMRIYCFYDTSHTTGKDMFINVKYGRNSFVFSDSKDIFDDYITQKFIDKITVLKVPYSGSYNYISPETIIKSDPQFIIISSSSRKKKRLNSDIFTTSLKIAGFDVYDTGNSGALIFESDGEKTELVEWE
jgi:competence protein ComEC